MKDLGIEYNYLSNTSDFFFNARKRAENVIKAGKSFRTSKSLFLFSSRVSNVRLGLKSSSDLRRKWSALKMAPACQGIRITAKRLGKGMSEITIEEKIGTEQDGMGWNEIER